MTDSTSTQAITLDELLEEAAKQWQAHAWEHPRPAPSTPAKDWGPYEDEAFNLMSRSRPHLSPKTWAP